MFTYFSSNKMIQMFRYWIKIEFFICEIILYIYIFFINMYVFLSIVNVIIVGMLGYIFTVVADYVSEVKVTTTLLPLSIDRALSAFQITI